MKNVPHRGWYILCMAMISGLIGNVLLLISYDFNSVGSVDCRGDASVVLFLVPHAYYAEWCGECSFGPLQGTEMRFDGNFSEARFERLDAEHVARQPWCRPRSPSVAQAMTQTFVAEVAAFGMYVEFPIGHGPVYTCGFFCEAVVEIFPKACCAEVEHAAPIV